LTIKGNQDGQLANPAGDRVLKAIVYDKAGLNSNAEKPSKRHFTVLTLEPPNVDVDLDEVKNGVEPPKIKELVEYFQEEKYWKAAGYTVSYESTNFDYDPSKKKFMPKDPNLAKGEYKVTVKLSFGNNHLTKYYKINVLGNDEAGINTGKFEITDVTNYLGGYPNLTIARPTFSNVGSNGKTCEVIVPYTSYETKLKVHVEAVGNGTIRLNPSDVDENKVRDLLVEDLGENSGSEKILTFYAYASDDITHKIYTIKFIRGGSVNVTAYLMNKVLQSNDCKLQMNWVYRENEINIQKNEGSKNDSLTVARGAEVTFTITTGEKDVIKKCSSSDAGHPQITIDNSKTMSFKLTANATFTLTADVGAEASFKWVDIGKRESSEGYTKAGVSYYLNNQPKNYSYTIDPSVPIPTPELAIQKGRDCEFFIEGLNPERHIVTKWKVNEAEIKQDGGNFKVSNDLTSLTIENPEGDYEVKVFTAPLYELTLEVYNENNETIATHAYSFEVKKGSETGTIILPKSVGRYVGIMGNTQVCITAQEDSNSEYDIEGWKVKKDTDTQFGELTGDGSEIGKRNLTITKNTTVRLILKKKTYKVEWSVEGGDQNITPPELKTRIKLNGGDPSPQGSDYVEIGAYALFELDPLEEGRIIKGWKVDGVEYLAGDSSKGITMSSDKKTLTLTNVKANHTVVLVLEVVKLRIKVEIEAPSGVADHKYTIKATKDDNVVTDNVVTEDNGSKYVFSNVEYSNSANWRFEAIKGVAPYVVKEWKFQKDGSTNWETVQPIQYDSGNSYKLKWAPTFSCTLKVVLQKEKFELTVTFDTQDNHGYFVKALDASGIEITPTNHGDDSSWKYEIEAGTEVKLEAGTSFVKKKYSIVEWQIKKGDDSNFTKITDSEEKTTIKITMEKKTDIQVVLAPEYIFTLNKKPNGKLKITNSDGSKVFGTLAANGNKSINTKEDIYFEITDLTGYDLVVSYKINGSEDDDRVKALFDKTTGFWKVERQKLALNPGDKFEVNIARFYRINISVRDYANNSNLYEGNEFTLKVSKTAGEGRLFPKFSNGDGAPLEIKKNMIENSNKYCTVYVPKDVTLRFDMEGLDGRGKEIGEWNGALSSVNDINIFNDESDKPDLRIGKDSNIQYTFPQSYPNKTYTLNACIRDKTAVLTVKLLEYTEGNDENKLHSDDSSKLIITVTETQNNSLLGTLFGNSESECKKRIKIGSDIKLEAIKTTGTDYYFACWKNGDDEKYPMTYEFKMPDKNCDIKAYWSKTFIVKMHRIPDTEPFRDVNAFFDAFDPKKNGFTKIILVDVGGVEVTKKNFSSNDMKNDKEGTLIPMFKDGISEESKNIKNIREIYFRIISLVNRNGFPFNPKKVVYKIAFGDKIDDKYETVKEHNNEAKTSLEGKTINSAILHVWLTDLDK